MKLEALTPNTMVRGILPDSLVTVVNVNWHGSDALTLVYRAANGRVAEELLYRHDEPRLEIVEPGRPWSFDGDGALFRLVAEAHRIRLAHLFDPVLAVHTSLVEPLPHQITAVYAAMLPRQPLRFLLADDPGAGKTIIAGLLIKELIARGDLKRCFIVCSGNIVEQWQDELSRKFHLPFEILTNDKLEAARTGNWFLENEHAIARPDKLARNENVQQKLSAPDCRYDLVVCDEAHKMAATFLGGEAKFTKRHRLGQLLAGFRRYFLLMTATRHNGKDEDFQMFLSLLDGDRFESKFRDGVHQVEVSDLMRRMVKESLLKFDGRPFFRECIAYTVPYKRSGLEAQLCKEGTEYVRQEFSRAEAREESWASRRRPCAENADHPQAKGLFGRKALPAFQDPFAGGGALPLEAQRLGLESIASDRNPLAVLINKVLYTPSPAPYGGHRRRTLERYIMHLGLDTLLLLRATRVSVA